VPTIPWDQVREVVDAVLDLPPEQRSPYLDQACQHPAVRRYVESLVLSYQQAGEFLDEPALAGHAEVLAGSEADSWKGRRVGPYQVIEEIGEGGMGSVYRAMRVDDQYQKQVAIKVVRSGFDTRFALTRFKAERQILANLEHPNIARLLEGGSTEDGQPYFVMEYIQGQPLDQYCDDHKLTITERLRLFRTVCSAVQYAHQNLVIHRDIKPNNILVNAGGVPKLLDFGIAKILSADQGDSSAKTMTMVRLLTPEYASPEQLLDEPITTASEIYSLGVVLYELLTGQRPYRFTTRKPDEIARVVIESEPQKPSAAVVRVKESSDIRGESVQWTPQTGSSTREGSPEKLRRRLSGDLDNIVLMALRKEPLRRYASVEQFSEDIRRHLEGLPVVARTDTFVYRSSKFVRRHTAGVTTAALVVLSLTLGLAFALREAKIAREQRARAEQRFDDVRTLAKSNLSEFHDAIQNLPGSAAARHLVIQRTLGYLDKLSHDAAGDREIMRELAAGYQRIGDLQGNFSGPGIGDSGAALESYSKAWTIRESLAASSGNDPADLKSEISLLHGYVRTLLVTGNTQEALRMAAQQLAIAELVAQKQQSDRDRIMDEARAHIQMGWVLAGNGSSSSTRELTEGMRHDRQAIELLGPLANQAADSTALMGLLQSTLDLAYHLRKNREFEASLKIYDAIWSKTSGLHGLPDGAQAIFYNHRARLFDDIADYVRADKDNRKSWELGQSLLKDDPHDLTNRINTAGALGTIGIDEARLGHVLAGKKKLDEAIKIGEEMLADNPYELFYKNLLLIGYSYRGEILSSMEDFPGALQQYTRSLTAATEIAHHDPGDLESRLNIAKLHAALGLVHARAAQYPEAKQEFNTALDNFQDLLRLRPQDAEAIHASKATQDAMAVVGNCSTARPCKGVSELRLPKINN
jgi:serine/threonine protein kinase/tetratricopeptide (TPR) repeat protein